MLKILITGLIGTGKTQTAVFLKNLNCLVFSADDYTNTLFRKDSPCYDQIKELFPFYFQTEKKTFNKKKIAKEIFKNSQKKSALESIIHPRVRQALDDFVKDSSSQNTQQVFCELPPVSQSMFSYFDKCILITSHLSIAQERLNKKGWTKQEIENRLKHQMDIRALKKEADFIIDNSKDLKYLHKQIKSVLSQLK